MEFHQTHLDCLIHVMHDDDLMMHIKQLCHHQAVVQSPILFKRDGSASLGM